MADVLTKKEQRGEIRLGDHLMRWGHSLIQISNVESISYLTAPTPPYPEKADELKRASEEKAQIGTGMCVFGAVALVLGFALRINGIVLDLIGVGLIAAGYYYFLRPSKECKEEADRLISGWETSKKIAQELKYLFIRMCSGHTYSFQFADSEELKSAFSALSEVIENGGKAINPVTFNNVIYQDNSTEIYNSEVKGGTVGSIGHQDAPS